MSETKEKIKVGNQSSTAAANGQTPAPPAPQPYIDLSLFPTNSAFWQKVKDEYAAIAGALPANVTDDRKRERGQLLIGDIAIATGFSIVNNTNTFNVNLANIAKFTYWMAFKLPFQQITVTVNNVKKTTAHPAMFESWWKGANRIRLKYWQDNVNNTSVPIYKRLHKRGEEELRDRSLVPQDELTPDIKTHAYNTLSKYNDYAGEMHKRLKQSLFPSGNITDIPLEYYLVADIESPFFSSGWVDHSKSVPYNLWEAGIPYPASGYKEAVVKNIMSLTNNQLVPIPHTEFFYPKTISQKMNFRQFPVFGTVIANNPNPILNGKMQIIVHLFRRQNVVLTPLTQGRTKAYFHNKPFILRPNGDIYIYRESNPPILKDQNGVNNYDPDIFNAISYTESDTKVYYDAAQDVNYVRELQTATTTLYADLELPAGLQASQLTGHRIYGIAQSDSSVKFSSRIPESTVQSNVTNAMIAGGSGITMAIGVDIGTSFSTASDPFAIKFENEILTPNCPNWAAMTTEKQTLRAAYGLTQKTAADYWVKNVVFFSKLDLQLNNNSYFNVLKSTIGNETSPDSGEFDGYFDTKYYNVAIGNLGDKLKTKLNFFEKYALLALQYNKPAISTGVKNIAAITEALNTHSYQKLLNVVKNSGTFSAKKIITRMEGQNIKDYYKNIHFNNI